MSKEIVERIRTWIRNLHLTTDEKKTILLVLVGSLVLGGLLLILDNQPLSGALLRNTYGGGTKKEDLLVTVGTIINQEEINLNLSERAYSKVQIEGAKDKVWEVVLDNLLEGHKSMDEISGTIHLPEVVEGYPFNITWNWSPREILNSKGEIQEDYIEEEGSVLLLTGTLTYGQWEYMYQQAIRVVPEQLMEEEQLRIDLYRYMELADLSNGEKESLTLPEEFEGHKVKWEKAKDYRGIYIIGLGILIGALLVYKKKQEEKDSQRLRREEMEMDYPQVVGAFLLYMGAGMTSKNAWYSIVNENQEKQDRHYIYDMMKSTYQEMCNGRSEIEAYEAFGIDTGLMLYRKFTLLLAQNVKKGTKGMTEILEHEAREAFEIRKRKAKALGEAAGTKLLLPMFLMLAVVLCIVIVPAFLSVQL